MTFSKSPMQAQQANIACGLIKESGHECSQGLPVKVWYDSRAANYFSHGQMTNDSIGNSQT